MIIQSAMTAAEALAGNREETLRFIKWAESWYRDLLISSDHEPTPDDIGEFGYAERKSQQQAAQMSVERESARRLPTPSTLE